MRIGYFADGPWSHQAFQLINNDELFNIAFVCGRYHSTDYVLKELTLKNNIVYLTSNDVNSSDFIGDIAKYDCDIFVSMSFNQVFKKTLIDSVPEGIINCHAGKLPFYRGRNVLNWVLINDEREFGITVHYVDQGIDTGDIILQETYPITDEDDYSSLLDTSYRECAKVLYKALKLIQKKEVVTTKQSSIHPLGMYCSRRKKGDEYIDWNTTSREIFNFVRALRSPELYAKTNLNNEMVVIKKTKVLTNAPIYRCINGAVLDVTDHGFLVKTQDSCIYVVEYDCECPIKVGDRLY